MPRGIVTEMMKTLGLAVVMVGIFLGAVPSAWADTVTVKASQKQGFGRLIFRWPQPVGYQAVRKGDRLVVTFARSIQADLRPVLRGLRGLVTSIEPAANDATVMFRIKGNFSVRSFDNGSSVVVDIVNRATGQTVGLKKASTVVVRTGTHATYSRVVFDWPVKAGFTFRRTGDTAVLTFNKVAQIDLAALAQGRLRNVGKASSSTANGKLAVTFKIDATSRMNTFASGAKVVVDVYLPGTIQPTKAAGIKAVKTASSASSQAQGQPPVPAVAPIQPVTVVDQALKPPTSLAPASLTPTPGTKVVNSAHVQAKPGASNRALGLAIPIKIKTMADGVVSMRLNWNEPVGAAVFRRGGALWLVFDKATKIDTAALVRGGAGLVVSVEQVPSNAGTVLRLTTTKGVNPDIKRAGLAWIFEFMKQPLFPSSPLQVDAQPNSPLGARLFISVPDPGNVIAFRDPEIGDNLVVVPVIPLSHGISRLWSYPQIQILASKQGVVVKPLSDNLSIRPLRQGVEITSTGTLQISSVSAEEKANVNLKTTLAASSGMGSLKPLIRVLDLEKWKRADLQALIKVRQDLQQSVARAKGARATEKANFEMASFFFANGFEAEAIGVLDVMLSARPELGNEPQFRLMRGAASWMMGRMADARKDLYHASLDGNDEGLFWRAAVVAGEGDLPKVAYELRKVGAITQPYPKAIKQATGTLIVEAAIELGDVKQATQYLKVLSIDTPTEAQKNQISYLSGKLKALSGDMEGAISDWESAMAGVHRPSRAKAAVARTELLLKRGKFTNQDAIDAFEKLRFVWRGDNFEFTLLRRLGDLYLAEKKYRKGLTALRQAVTHFPQHKDANMITKKMSDTFIDLYMNNAADVLAPVTAIALYDEFRELTPAGAAGDEMIRKLADRLVGVDLLGRAAALLEAQVGFRLVGEEKAKVGARLALIYLFDRRYQRALDALDKTKVRSISKGLVAERILLRAQGHIGRGQPDLALELLRPETSLSAEKIRSGIYWRAKNWKEAAKSLTKVVRDLKVRPRKPLNDKQAAAVLALGIASTLEKNEAAVARVTANFGPAMAKSVYADAFKLITAPPELGLVNYRNLAPIVKEVDNFQSFMTIYRQRAAQGQLSSLY